MENIGYQLSIMFSPWHILTGAADRHMHACPDPMHTESTSMTPQRMHKTSTQAMVLSLFSVLALQSTLGMHTQEMVTSHGQQQAMIIHESASNADRKETSEVDTHAHNVPTGNGAEPLACACKYEPVWMQ